MFMNTSWKEEYNTRHMLDIFLSHSFSKVGLLHEEGEKGLLQLVIS